jgi:hypothetical protein
MAMFTGFKPQGLQKIASKMGYAGRMEEFDQYLQQNPDKQREMLVYQGKAQEMARGGMVRRMAVGGFFDKQGNSYSGVTNKYNQQGQLGFTQQYESDPDSGAQSTRTVYADPNQQFYTSNPTTPGDNYGPGSYSLKGLGYNVPAYKPPATMEQFPIAPAPMMGTPSVAPMYGPEGTYSLTGKPDPNQPKVTPMATAPSEFMSSPGFDPRYEGTDQQSYGQQNQVPVRKPVADESFNVPISGNAPPSYINPIDPPTDPNNPFGPVGSAVMRYAYNPTTNQYSISGGGQQSFPAGFESSMDAGALYKKYPQIQGVFDKGPPGLPAKANDDIFSGIFGGANKKQSDTYINKLKENYSGSVYRGDSPDFGGGFGGNYFTEEFTNYAKSQGFDLDNTLAQTDGPQMLKYTGQGEPFTQQPQFQYPQSYMSNYTTQDGKSIAPPFESSRSPLELYTTKEDYISYASKSYDDRRAYYNNEIKKLTDRGFVLQADGFYRSPNTGGASKISGFDDVLKQTKEQYVAKQLEAKGKYDVERAGATGGLPDFRSEEKARQIKSDKENISKTNEQLAKIGLSPIDINYYDSPEYKYYLDNKSMIGMPAFGFSKYFGPQNSQEPGGGREKAYEAYLKRMGQDDIIQKANSREPSNEFGMLPTNTNLPGLGSIAAGGSGGATGINTTNSNTGSVTMNTNNPLPQQPTPVQGYTAGMDITDVAAQRLSAPSLPSGGQVVGQGITQEAGQYINTNQGQVSGAVAVPTSLATTTQAQMAAPTDANTMAATQSAGQVNAALGGTQAAQIDPNDTRAQVNAAQNAASSVSQLQASQGVANVMQNPMQRQIQAGEVISGVANAQAASTYAEQIQAATATPSEKATVQGQLANLTANFDASNPPAWAAGTLRAVQAQMASRGLGASSMAGQAMIQGALESALPIAQADAQVNAQFEGQNLSNRQARAMLAAQQRATFIGQEFDQAFQARVQNSAKISDIANMNFTAEQSIALENSRAVNTMSLQNMSNSQAMVIAEASALANMDMSNLNNRQQASVQNAQSFLQMDMANVSNEQQTELFKAQQRVQSLFTDQAATNAASQFNASSQNQVEQFFANLATQSSQFNATQSNAQSQYNSGQRNVLERFNAELNNQRDTFNAQNRLVIDQNNATWRRQIATSDTATINRVNEINATNMLATSNQAYNDLWNYYGDTMEWAWTSAENELNRYADMAIANLNADTQEAVAKRGAGTASGNAIGSLIGTLGSAWIMGCWVAREVYGNGDPRWFIFRMWLKYKAPKWFKNLYDEYGEDYAKFIKKKPIFKWMTRKLMDLVVKEKSKKGMVSYV